LSISVTELGLETLES